MSSSILEKIVGQKKIEIAAAKQRTGIDELKDQIGDSPPIRDFLDAIQTNDRISLIAEVKKASPSKGIIREDFDPVEIARAYQESGATCVSVLTDEIFFQGHLEFLRKIRSTVSLPLLRKDFVIDPYQVYEARVAGADAVLLIAECLSANLLSGLHDQIVDLGMTPLVEFYDPANLGAVLECGAKLVGVNNRDLNTFETDLNHCIQMRGKIPGHVTMVGESGIFTAADVMALESAGIDAMLVGESLMRSDDVRTSVQELMSTG